ncbi:hypothetical protein Bpfe_011168 [Biomphalaria pfeifferi]|uniref:ShKT domain-containing protein n=1 Tax=Biomphalaria pfeifferi TaxID=112525 RepID=A0AAD8BRB1_BIOPF|nr:hypothetical protein Bpfe_011168 [Biomphalaria pfeifferi]
MIIVWLILNLFLLNDNLVLAEDNVSEATLSLQQLQSDWPFRLHMKSTFYQPFQEAFFNKNNTSITLQYEYQDISRDAWWLIKTIPTKQDGNINDCFECSYDPYHSNIKCNKTPVARECSEYAKCSSGPGILWSSCKEYLSSVHLRNMNTTCLGRCLVFYFLTTPVNSTVAPTSSPSTRENIAITNESPQPTIAKQMNNEDSPFSTVSLISSSVAASVGTFLILLIVFVIRRKRRQASRRRNENVEVTNTVVSQRTLNSISYENASNVHQQTSRANETTASSHERADSVIYTEIARSTNSQSNSGNHFNADKDYIHAVDVNNYFLVTGLHRSISQLVENACIWGAETSERVHTSEYSSKADHDNGRKLMANNDHINTNACKIDKCVAKVKEKNCIEKNEREKFDNNTERCTSESNKNKTSRNENSSARIKNNENIKSKTPEFFPRQNVSDNQLRAAVALQAEWELSVQEGSDGVRKYNPLDSSTVEVHQYLPLAHKQTNRNDFKNVLEDAKDTISGQNINYVDLVDDQARSNTVSDHLSSLGLVDGMLKLCQ